MQRMIDCGTWDDPWFADLEPDAKLLFLYLLTNRRSTAAGAFEITIKAMAFETGLDQKRIEIILNSYGDRVQWWPDHRIIWIRNFFKRQAANDKFTISAQRHVADLPIPVQQQIATVYPNLISEETPPPDDTHAIPTAMGIDTPSVVEGSNREDREIGEEGGEGDSGADAPHPPPAADKPPPKPKRATRIPANFSITDDLRKWALERGMTALDVERRTETFTNYWTGESGAKASKLDWFAAWKVWISRDFPDTVPRNGALTVHAGGRTGSIDAAEASRIEWRRRNGLIPDDSDEDVIEAKASVR